MANDKEGVLPSSADGNQRAGSGVASPMEAHGSYRGSDWSPERLAFHQNLEQFADRVGLIVGLQGNGKISQEAAYDEIKKLWKSLRGSRSSLFD